MNVGLKETDKGITLLLRGQTENEHTAIRDFMLKEDEHYKFEVDGLVHKVFKVKLEEVEEEVRNSVPDGLKREDLETLAGQVGATNRGTDYDVAKDISRLAKPKARKKSNA